MMRLLVTAELPIDLRATLVNMQDNVMGVDWTLEDALRVTLMPVADVNIYQFKQFKMQLHMIEQRAFTLQLGGLKIMPDKSNPQSLWLVAMPSLEITQLRQGMTLLAEMMGITVQATPHPPYVKLAGLKDAEPHQLERYMQDHINFTGGKVLIDKFDLYSARATSQGTEWDYLDSYPLG